MEPPSLPDDRSLRDLLLRIRRRQAQARHRLVRAGVAAPGTTRRGPARDTESAPLPQREVPPEPATNAASGTVLEVRRVADGLISFKLARPSDFQFRPGQSVRIAISGLERRYSLVSAPHERFLEFFVEIVPGGRMSDRLRGLRPGSRITIAGNAKGKFALDESARRHLMLATVTGVNPYVGMLRDALHRGERDLGCVLVHGASHADEFGYREELERLAAARPDLLVYIPTVSRPDDPRNAGWEGATGRADSLIDPVRGRYGLSPAETNAYACGNPGMVDNARRHLGALGFEVRTERYT